MRFVILIGALALAGCANKLDIYEDAAKRVRQVCVENGNALGTQGFNQCFNSIWVSTMLSQGQGNVSPPPLPVNAAPQPIQPLPVPAGQVRCQNFGGITRCM
jgi:hypothetical protein